MSLDEIAKACRLVARTYYGQRGLWLCDAFEAINAKFFAGELPYPHITIQVTNYSSCLAWCSSSDSRPPAIAIHPSLFGSEAEKDPWGIPAHWLGKRYAFDALLHECIHASVHYRLGGYEGASSHNNDQWVSEVNRLAPLLGFRGVTAGRQVAKRVAVPGELTKTGKPKSAVRKVDLGNIPFNVTARFPSALRSHQKKAGQYYTRGQLPVKIDPPKKSS